MCGKLLLVFAGVAVGLLLCEAGLRLGGYSYPNFYVRDEVVGSALRPNAEGWWTREGRDYIRINSQGLRDREHAKAKPADTIRIAVLGDSYAEALQLPMEKAFWAIAEAKLQACQGMRGQQVEVINFGVSGYGTAQELLTLRQRVWEYDPDIVLLTITTRNDIRDNSRAISQSDIPYFVRSGGRLVLDDSFRHSRTYRFRDSTPYRVLQWMRGRSRAVQAVFAAASGLSDWTRRRSNPDIEPLVVYQQRTDPVWQEAWAVTEALIVLMRDEVTARHAQFFVVTLSGPLQIDPDTAARQASMAKYGIKDLFYPDFRIRDMCERHNIPVLVLAPRLQDFAERNNLQLHGWGTTSVGHWNELGHRVAGGMMATWLCERLTH